MHKCTVHGYDCKIRPKTMLLIPAEMVHTSVVVHR